MTRPYVLSITTGDIDGIGYEISVKALIKKKPEKHQHIILWRSPKCLRKYTLLLKKNFKVKECSNLNDAINFFQSSKFSEEIVEIVSEQNPALWVEQSALFCLEKKISALVTGPLSKQIIFDAGLKDIGHTGILSRVSKSKDVFMTFLGNKFNVLCLTGHIPIHLVEQNITTQKIKSALQLSLELRQKLPKTKRKLPIGILGLNPHASEGGLIGQFDLKLSKLISDHNNLNKLDSFHGPIVPDVAFLKHNWHKYSVFICLYHDQGLIPFKLVHGQDSGVHYSLGLPFVRTSVDHGTAKDIYGKDLANCNSMLDAISWASRMISS